MSKLLLVQIFSSFLFQSVCGVGSAKDTTFGYYNWKRTENNPKTRKKRVHTSLGGVGRSSALSQSLRQECVEFVFEKKCVFSNFENSWFFSSKIWKITIFRKSQKVISWFGVFRGSKRFSNPQKRVLRSRSNLWKKNLFDRKFFSAKVTTLNIDVRFHNRFCLVVEHMDL